jgi:CheY-like chemotaxis protein
MDYSPLSTTSQLEHQKIPFEKPMSANVLLVEDDEDIREALCEFLSDTNLNIAPAANGHEALHFLEMNAFPPLILIDLSLPGMSGEELIKTLNQHEKRDQTTIVIASGWDNLQGRSEELGADSFLRKPYDLSTLGKNLTDMVNAKTLLRSTN